METRYQKALSGKQNFNKMVKTVYIHMTLRTKSNENLIIK